MPPALLCIPSVFVYLSSLVSPFTWSRPAYEYLNDINRVVITLTPVMAEALLRATVLTTLCHPQALTLTPINTYEYWQRPAISIITLQNCVSASAADNFRSQVRVSALSSSFWKDVQANPVSSFLHYLNDQYERKLRGHTRPAWPPPPTSPTVLAWSRTNKQKYTGEIWTCEESSFLRLVQQWRVWLRGQTAPSLTVFNGSLTCQHGVKVMVVPGTVVLFVYVCLTVFWMKALKPPVRSLFAHACVWWLRAPRTRLWGGWVTNNSAICMWKCTWCLSLLDCVGLLLCLVNTAVWCENGDCSSTMGASLHKFLGDLASVGLV